MRRLLPVLLLTAASSFAYTPIQVGPNTCKFNPGSPGSGDLTCDFPSSVGGNNVIVVGVEVRVGSATSVTNIHDTLNTSFSLKVASPNPATMGTMALLYVGKPSSGGANTVTV